MKFCQANLSIIDNVHYVSKLTSDMINNIDRIEVCLLILYINLCFNFVMQKYMNFITIDVLIA